MKIQIEQVVPNPEQPRKVFDEGEIAVLADSLSQHGLLNPIAVEGPYDGYYILLDGERRLRAARMAGWEAIEAHVMDGDGDANDMSGRLMLALVGNLQRTDLGPVDEAKAYARLRDEMSVRDICERVGRSDAHVYGRLRMLELGLAQEVLDLVNLRRLPSDIKMLRALSELPDEMQVPLVQRAARSNCSASRIKGLVTRALHRRPLHHAQRPVQGSKMDPAPAPALAAGAANTDELPGGMVEAIIKACKRCGLGSDSCDDIICRDCPLTNFVQLFAERFVPEEPNE
jgi:ParB family chromosome partitioning protein